MAKQSEISNSQFKECVVCQKKDSILIIAIFQPKIELCQFFGYKEANNNALTRSYQDLFAFHFDIKLNSTRESLSIGDYKANLFDIMSK